MDDSAPALGCLPEAWGEHRMPSTQPAGYHYPATAIINAEMTYELVQVPA